MNRWLDSKTGHWENIPVLKIIYEFHATTHTHHQQIMSQSTTNHIKQLEPYEAISDQAPMYSLDLDERRWLNQVIRNHDPQKESEIVDTEAYHQKHDIDLHNSNQT